MPEARLFVPRPFHDHPEDEDSTMALGAAPVKVANKVLDIVMGTAVGLGLGYLIGGLGTTLTGGLMAAGLSALVGNDLRSLAHQLTRESLGLLRQMSDMNETSVKELTRVINQVVNRVHNEITNG